MADESIAVVDVVPHAEEMGLVERQSVVLQDCSLVVNPEITFDEYRVALERFITVEKSVQWWIGDLLLAGEEIFGEEASQAIPEHYSKKSLQNFRWVAKSIPVDERHPGVPWALHAELAGMKPDVRKMWLELASQEQFTRAALRNAITAKITSPEDDPPSPGVSTEPPPQEEEEEPHPVYNDARYRLIQVPASIDTNLTMVLDEYNNRQARKGPLGVMLSKWEYLDKMLRDEAYEMGIDLPERVYRVEDDPGIGGKSPMSHNLHSLLDGSEGEQA